MQLLAQVLQGAAGGAQLLAAIERRGCPAGLLRPLPVLRAYICRRRPAETGRSVVLLCADRDRGERLSRDLRGPDREEVRLVAAREFTFHHAAVVSRHI